MHRNRPGRTLAALAAAAALLTSVLAAPAAAAPESPVPATPLPAADAPTAANGDTIVHLFQWNWNSVAAECEDFLGPNGFGGVQVSPPQEHVVIPFAEGGNYPWWQDYQPVSYQIDNTRRGTAEEFEDMVETCRDNGVRIYADVVINHMTGPGSGTGSNGTPWAQYDHPDLFGDGTASYGRDNFGPCYETITDWNDKWEVQNCRLLDLADLDTADPQVRSQIRRYLNGLIGMGVAGFRVDASKHVPEAHIAEIFRDLDEVPGFGGQPHIYHEVYGDATIPYTNYAPYGLVTNFDYQRDVSAKVRDGNLSPLLNMPRHGGLDSDEALVFIDNHDTQRYEPTLTHKNGARYHLATAFMLAHPYGTPVVMSSYDFGGAVAEGPPSTGTEPGNPAGWITADSDCSSSDWVCEHRAPAVAGMAAFRNAVGDTALTARAQDGSSRVAFDRGGRGFAAFNAGGGTWNLTASTDLPDGTYENAAGPGSYTVSGGRVTVQVPADGAVALHVGGTCDDPAECGGGDDGGGDDGGGDGGGGDEDCTTVAAEFHVEASTRYGQEIHVVGSLPELGSWNPRDGLRLRTDENTYPWWSGGTDLPVGTEFEYKFVKIDGAGDVVWESGANRVATGDDSAGGCKQVFTEYWR
ncbi:carbohydrate-binding module family 20 domain-containing protein [Nocardiopsis algeriensis]|uniref:Alpha-amylase n=1 Tax=Nocardiopsis algeriensis TaxID=1478215 RepID=A0A841IKG4_9ACTN|nr:carbohydrate-binding module family 20 domain-containing protein [Nocardiopsis algeriensis]MBB6119269.1 alpha-amylase [Nocardiopsis algeriensis]